MRYGAVNGGMFKWECTKIDDTTRFLSVKASHGRDTILEHSNIQRAFLKARHYWEQRGFTEWTNQTHCGASMSCYLNKPIDI